MRLIYVPIADSFFESSIMQEELPVRFVMLALIRLALRAGADGVVDVDLRTFAGSINIPPEDVERAIKRLMEPDPSSGCPDEEGRRIVPVDPARPFRGWRLVNWAKYRHIVHLANDAARKRDKRTEADIADTSENVRERPGVSANGATKNEERNTKNEERRTKEEGEPPSLRSAKAGAAAVFERLRKDAEGDGFFEEFLSEERYRFARQAVEECPGRFEKISIEDLAVLWQGGALRGTKHDKSVTLLWARDPDGFMSGGTLREKTKRKKRAAALYRDARW